MPKLAWRFALLYILLIGGGAAFDAAIFLKPVTHKHVTVKACTGNVGMERCLREQFKAQGAPDPSVTCGTPSRFPGYVEYLCVMNAGLGSGCYDVVADRSRRDGYPLTSSVSQRPSC